MMYLCDIIYLKVSKFRGGYSICIILHILSYFKNILWPKINSSFEFVYGRHYLYRSDIIYTGRKFVAFDNFMWQFVLRTQAKKDSFLSLVNYSCSEQHRLFSND